MIPVFYHFKKINSVVKEFIHDSRFFQAGCLLLAISRFLQVISFFLPLKILILLSSENKPAYLENIPIEISYDALLLIFILFVPVCYFGYILAGILHRYLLDKDLSLWMSGKKEMGFIDVKHKNKISKIHGHISKMASEMLLVIFSLALVASMDILMFLLVLVLITLEVCLFVSRAFYISESDRIGFFRLHRRQYIEFSLSISFIFVFFVLVIQIKYFSIGIFEALFVLLVSRMMLQAVQRLSIENIYVVSYLSGHALPDTGYNKT